jgi:pyridoxamine 5'-phosphate oxidase
MSDSASIQHPGGLTSGDFTEADEPLRLFAAWFSDASRSEPADPSAMTLATVDADGLPNARMVLLKGFDELGFVFYTNLDSQKGRELGGAPKGALVFHWKSLSRQVRLRGPLAQVEDHVADAYFATRPRLGQQAVRPARKPDGLREGGRLLHGQIRGRGDPAAAELVRLSAAAPDHRILAGSALSAA